MKRVMMAVFIVSMGPAACSGTSTNDATSAEPDAAVADILEEIAAEGIICSPECTDRNCGDDGCGGSCGLCAPGDTCEEGKCPICVPDCTSKECGIDGCGGYCGNGDAATQGCEQGDLGCDNGMCMAGPGDCSGKECGSDGADGSCGTCPCDSCEPDQWSCNESGLCEAPPECGCMCIFECFDTCPADDQTCFENCVNSASVESQIIYNDLITCLDEAKYFDCEEDDDDCLNETFNLCLDQYYECFHGDAECVDMYLCLIGCPAEPAGDICAQDCFANGTVEALKFWDLLIDCLDTSGYYDCPEGDEPCLDDAWAICEEDFWNCAHGDDSCSEMFDCVESCAPTDEMCGTSCLVHGTIEAQIDWDDMVDCIVEQCGEDGDADCENSAIEDACAGVYDACIGS